MRSAGVRVVLSLGRPDPDRLSTAMLWSLLAHFGLLAAVVVAQLIPSESSKMGEPHFVTLAAPGRPAAGGGGSAEPEPPKPSTAPPPAPQPPPQEPPAPSHAPTKASVPSDKPPKPPPPAHAREAAPPSEHETHEPPRDGPAAGDAGEGKPGAAPGPAGGAAGEAGGVSGTSFGEGDFRFGWYQSAIEAKLQAAWRRPMAAGEETLTATVSFIILRNGAVKDVQVVTPSGNAALDLSTMRAVYDATPLPPLPRGWAGDSVHVTIEFSLKPGAP